MSEAKTIASASELAKLVEKNRGTVTRWLKRKDWPFGKPPWKLSQLPAILNWIADTLLPRDPSPAPAAAVSPESDSKPDEMLALRKQKLQNEIRKLHAQADTAQTELARATGKLLDAEAIEKEWAAAGQLIRTGFQNLPMQLIPLALNHGLPSEACAAFQNQIEQLIAGILRVLSRDRSEADDDRPTPAAGVAVPA